MRVNSKAVTVNLRVVKGIPWIWAAVGTFVMWVVLGLFAHNLNPESLVPTSTNASFAIVALGQMLVITTGGGAIDLSIPSVITLSAFLSAGIASGSNLRALYAVPVVLVTGGFIGLVNASTVLFLRIPPIIATLGTGYIVTTAILIYNPHFTTAYVAPVLLHVARDRLFGVLPLVLLITIAIVILLSLMLTRTRYGKCLTAVGQNLEAARLTGMPVNLIQVLRTSMQHARSVRRDHDLGTGERCISRTWRPLPASDGGERRGGRDADLRRKGGPAGNALRESLLRAPRNGDAGSGFENRRSARR